MDGALRTCPVRYIPDSIMLGEFIRFCVLVTDATDSRDLQRALHSKYQAHDR